MKSNNKLNTALKDALYEHHEPLHDSQWERLRVELEEKKKRRFLPWLLLFFGVALGAGLIGMYLESRKCTIAATVKNASEQTNSHASESAVISPKVNTDTEALAKTEPSVDNDFNTVKVTKGFEHHTSQISSGRKTIKNGSFRSGPGKDIASGYEPVKSGPEIPPFQMAENGEGNKMRIEIPQLTVPAEEILDKKEEPIEDKKTEVENPESDKTEDPSKTLTKIDDTNKKSRKDDSTREKTKLKFVIGGSAGIAGVTSKVTGVSNEESLHKDSRNIFKMSNENQSAMFFNFNFEWALSQKVNLRFNTGLHYKRVDNRVNFSYKLREIPIRMPDNTIISYITVPDSSNPLIINVRENQTYSFLSLPLVINYSWPINKNSELLMGAGVNLSALVGSTGSGFSLNELSYKQAGDMVKNPLSFGLNASLGYSRRLYGNWWLSAEAGFQSMNLQYDMGYGDLKSQMLSQGLALNLRYKILK
ncbi:MAG: hypothetical protein ACKOXF_05010 [Chitinophagaceae bacterium]